MDIFVPFDAHDPKSRLEPPLSAAERGSFAEAMLADVIDAIEATGHAPRVLSTAPMDLSVPVLVDERPLTKAVNGLFKLTEGPVAIVMADLPLITPEAIDRLVSTDGEVVIAPGVGGGTNALIVRDRAFHVDFHGCSFRDHRTIAERAELTVATVDSYSLACDIDEPADLAEVLLHSDGRASRWLERQGIVITESDEGRVTIERTTMD